MSNIDNTLELSSMELRVEPRDELREGLGTFKTDQQLLHPVELIQQNYAKQQHQNHLHLMSKVYGSHVPMKLQMESTILSQFHRLPGLPSSRLGLETVMGLDEDIDFGDYMNQHQYEVRPAGTIHEQMEKRLGDKPFPKIM